MEKETFESAIKKLEVITRELENGDIDLELSLKKYKEANDLLDFCTKKLKEAEKTVNKVLNDKGKFEDFEV